MSPRALFRHQVATPFCLPLCLPAKRVIFFILSSGLFEDFLCQGYNKTFVWQVDAFTPSMHVIFFALLSPWVLGTREMSCILAIIVFIFRWHRAVSSQPGYFGFVTIPHHEEGCIGKYGPPALPPRIERFAKAEILHPEALISVLEDIFFIFLSFSLCSFSQPWSLSVLFPLTCRVGGMGSQAGLATSRQVSYVWLCFKKMLK